jgi:hypothetical protein
MTAKDPSICCPEFKPELYEKKTHVWNDKLFLKDQVVQFLHIPLNMGSVVKRMVAKVEKSEAMPEVEDFLLLAYDPSPWKSELYMTVTRAVLDGHMERLSGTFLSRVFDGPYNAVPQWIKEMDAYVASEGKTVKRYYFHYAYCPKCSKTYGHNYCVAFAQVE